MGCLHLSIGRVITANTTIVPVRDAKLTVSECKSAHATIVDTPKGTAQVSLAPNAKANVTPVRPMKVTIGEVCSISEGDLVVLAADDGILRTRDGGFFLLNPDTNPAEQEPDSSE